MSANDELQAHTCEKMLEEYGNVANNVAQGNSQDLTEQWKNGELERGWYYIKKLLKNRVVMDFYYGNDVDRWMDNYDEEIKEVLAQVPSYEECQKLKERVQGLECELLEVINVLLKVSPEHEEWINMNFPYYKRGEL